MCDILYAIIYRVFKKKMHKVCYVINFEPFVYSIAVFAPKCDVAVNFVFISSLPTYKTKNI